MTHKETKKYHDAQKEQLVRTLDIYGTWKLKLLADKLGIFPRQVKYLVQELRHANYPIGYGQNGYFLAKDDAELCHTKNKFKIKNQTTVQTMYDLDNANYNIDELKERDFGDEAVE